MDNIDAYVKYANALPGGMRITPLRQDSLTYMAAESLYMRGSKKDAESSLFNYYLGGLGLLIFGSFLLLWITKLLDKKPGIIITFFIFATTVFAYLCRNWQ